MKFEKDSKHGELFSVGVYIEDELTVFAECTSEDAAEKAKTYLEAAGWEDVEIVKSNLMLDVIEINGRIMDLNEKKELVPMEQIIREPYVITPCKNAYNDKISFWITRDGHTKACYCFSVKPYEVAEFEYQMKNIDGYIKMFNDMQK